MINILKPVGAGCIIAGLLLAFTYTEPMHKKLQEVLTRTCLDGVYWYVVDDGQLIMEVSKGKNGLPVQCEVIND